MKFNKFAYLYSKPLGHHTLKISRFRVHFEKVGTY